MSLITSSSFFVYISCHIQTGSLASDRPPLTAPLWDHRFSPGMGNFYHDHAKRLTTCHEKIVECQGQKTRGLESMLIIVFIQASRFGGLPSHVCLSSWRERVVWQAIGPVFGTGKGGKDVFTNTATIFWLWFCLTAENWSSVGVQDSSRKFIMRT